MKTNYPAAIRGGVSQQHYEATTLMQRRGIQTLLKAAGVQLEGATKVLDLGARAGDTTLGVLEHLPNAHVIGLEEPANRLALLLAKTKFGIATEVELKEVAEISRELPAGYLDSFRLDSAPHAGRVSFEELHWSALPLADAAVGYQLLHWLDADSTGAPKPEILQAIANALSAGGVFISGTSTAFVQLDPDLRVEGKTQSEYSIDKHPFVQMVYDQIAKITAQILGKAPEPITANPPLSMNDLSSRFLAAGFSEVRVDGFLVTPGRDQVVREVVKLRPAHQGRLEGIALGERSTIIQTAIANANAECETVIAAGAQDPRLIETNVWDVVPFIGARK
ncbi:class I SAM-dependent methyltransferase [Candidatus Micrarchaeota archaeon]|nr:class I SAM-dependent methyltransferase [Candidatus Micrarchaeota archaeon]